MPRDVRRGGLLAPHESGQQQLYRLGGLVRPTHRLGHVRADVVHVTRLHHALRSRPSRDERVPLDERLGGAFVARSGGGGRGPRARGDPPRGQATQGRGQESRRHPSHARKVRHLDASATRSSHSGYDTDCRFATQELSETHFHFLSETVDVASRDGTKPRASRSTGVRPSGSPRRHRPEGAFQLSDPSHLPLGARAAREAPRPTRITTHAARRSLFANRRRGGGCARRVSATGRERTTRRSDFRGERPRAWMTHASSPACETSSCRVAQPRARPRASSASADPRRSRRRFALRVLPNALFVTTHVRVTGAVVFFLGRENKTSPEPRRNHRSRSLPAFPVRRAFASRVLTLITPRHAKRTRETLARNPRRRRRRQVVPYAF